MSRTPPTTVDEFMIDEFATLWSHVPRIASRMFAALLLSGEELSSHELVERLGVSSASVSTMGRLLVGLGMVERRVSPETRRDLFRVPDDAWAQLQRDDERIISQVVDWLERAIDLRRRRDGEAPDAMIEMRNFFAFLEQEIPTQIARYAEWRTSRSMD
jgi:DNA-binding transcriptional regulator GbsR (MarR family)